MCNGDAGFRYQLLQTLQTVLYGLDFVVQKIALTAAFEFTQHGFADDAVVFGSHKSLDR